MFKNTVQIKKGEYFQDYSFNSKNDLKQNSMQYLLKSVHLKTNAVRCKCDMNKELYLSVKKIGNLYYLAKYPKSEEHHSQCVFHTLINDLLQIEDENIAYKSSIFEEPEQNSEESKSSRHPHEQAKRHTFYMYCHDLISQANKIAFLMANKNSKELQSYKRDNFFKAFYAACMDVKIVGNGNVINYCKKNKGSFFEFGIVPYDIVGNLDLLNCSNNNEVFEIDLNPVSYILKEKKSSIGYGRLKTAKKLVTNFSNITAIPYFYIAVYNNRKIVRFYIAPIYINNEYICFVDSGYEREYANWLYQNNIPFIKPISNDELDMIYPYKIGLPQYVKKIPHIVYRSDFILLKKGHIIIVEVSGYNDIKYQKLLNKKSRYYQMLCDKHLYFKFMIVDGKSMEVLEQNRPLKWDGLEIITSGKYKDMAWRDVPSLTLDWYIENLAKNTDTIKNAKKELYRRKNNKGEN
jgi:hypothetical protein